MNPAVIETISAQGGSLVGSGSVAKLLLQNGFNIAGLRTNDVLRKDEWKQYDTALVEVAHQRTPLVQALVGAGLSVDIPNGLGTTILEWENVSDMDPADVSMSGVTRGEYDRLDYNLQSMPLPIVHKDFTINIRALEASRRTGQPLDTAQVAQAGRVVTEAIESMVVVGHATRVGASRIYGLTTEPNINTGSQTADWDLVATTGEQRVTDVLAMIAAAQADHMYGPYALLVNYTTWNQLLDDYKANSDKTTLERIQAIEGISTVIPSSDVPASASILVQLTKDVIDEVIGLQPTIVQWETQGGMMMHFKVMAIMIPRVRSTQTSQSGIVYYT